MKKRIIVAVLSFCAAFSLQAQQSLVGRVYYDQNIMKKLLDDAMTEANVDQKLREARDSAYIKAEKEAGHPLSAQEKAKVDEKVQKAQKMMDTMKKGMSMAVTIEFKSETQLVMKADMKVDDEVLKAAGVPWAKRKLMKAAMAVMPAQKADYVRQGNLIIYTDDKDRDTLVLSSDGRYLSGKMDRKTPFKLTRTK